MYLRYMEEFISVLPSLFCHISGSIRHRQLGCFFSGNSFPVSTCLQLSRFNAGFGTLNRCVISTYFHPFSINHNLKHW